MSKDDKKCGCEVSRADVEEAVRTIIKWTGDDAGRDGLQDTPARVTRSFEEFFSGYAEDPQEFLSRTFEETDGYDEMVLLRDIPFVSHCEHHMLPIIGRAHVAYIPRDRVVGISKLARVVNLYAKRLQIQEKMTAQVANAIEEVLKPYGCAVVIEAEHQCMSIRGVKTGGSSLMITSKLSGAFKKDAAMRAEFMSLCGLNRMK